MSGFGHPLSLRNDMTDCYFPAYFCRAMFTRTRLLRFTSNAVTTPSDSKSGKKSSKNPIKTLLRDVRALPKTIRDIVRVLPLR